MLGISAGALGGLHLVLSGPSAAKRPSYQVKPCFQQWSNQVFVSMKLSQVTCLTYSLSEDYCIQSHSRCLYLHLSITNLQLLARLRLERFSLLYRSGVPLFNWTHWFCCNGTCHWFRCNLLLNRKQPEVDYLMSTLSEWPWQHQGISMQLEESSVRIADKWCLIPGATLQHVRGDATSKPATSCWHRGNGLRLESSLQQQIHDFWALTI